MSYRLPQRHRPDQSAEKIIAGLRSVGYVVVIIGHPVDVMVTHPSWPPNTWRLAELKTPQGKAGSLRLLKKQQEQQEFCARHGVPYLLDAERAIQWLNINRPVWRASRAQPAT